MKPLLSASEMKRIDTYTIEEYGISSLELMERAARAVEAEIIKGVSYDKNILILCGMGNNGADGLALARMLTVRGYRVRILTVGRRERATKEWEEQYKHILPEQEYHIEGENDIEKNGTQIRQQISEAEVLVDAIFGIGLTREITGIYAWVIKEVNASLAEWKKQIYAVDMPSGIHTDTGNVMGCAVMADVTVTFGHVKRGQIFYPGVQYCGKCIVADIGFAGEALSGISPECYTFENTDLEKLPKRRPDSNKGTYGKLLVAAGCKGMAGAAILSSLAAYRMGCGLVSLMTDEENRIIVQSVLPEAVFFSMQDMKRMEEKLRHFSAAVIGPGLGTGQMSKEVLKTLLSVLTVPVVLDADALNLIAVCKDLEGAVKQYAYGVVMTPHLGELSRLLSCEIPVLKKDLVPAAKQLAEKFSCVCAAKDSRTVVAAPDKKVYINTSGNDGMATGGSGDVLSGIIGGMLAQGKSPYDAAALGVYIHGLAGDAAAQHLGRASMLARDIADSIYVVLKDEMIQQ